MSGTGRAWRQRASVLLMMLSGFAALGYQVVWTQQCALWLGHESAAVLAVVTAFFGGLSLGAWRLGPDIEQSPRPVRWYAGCELLVGLWSALLVFTMPAISTGLLSLTGARPSPTWHWAVAFCGTFLVFLPATAAMGATLPAMERLTADNEGQVRSLAGLYASNTFGALLGVLSSAFYLIPDLGLRKTALICSASNVLCGASSLGVWPASADAPAMTASAPPLGGGAGASGVANEPEKPGAESAPSVERAAQRGLSARLALTGFLGIGYEVLVVRVLSEVTENTVYTFAVLLAVYLVGTALGAAGYQRYLLAQSDRRELGDRLLGVLSAACLLGTATLWTADKSQAWALEFVGRGPTSAMFVEAVPALFAFGPQALVMGALFSHLSHGAHRVGLGFGRALGWNTLGAAAAPAVFGVVVLPAFGPKLALLLVIVGYLGLVPRRTWSRPHIWLPAAGAAALLLFAPPLSFVDVPEGGHVVSYEDGVMAAVSVVEDADGVARLRIDDRQQEGSSATLRVDGRQAWLPLLLHPSPRRALFLGLGTGITASSAAEDPTLDVTAVELLPEVIRASARFTREFAEAFGAPRLHVLSADARRYLRTTRQNYDVIVSDNFHPARSGSGALYTTEHFQAVRARLTPRGIFCQWLPLHQLDLETVGSIVQSFLAAFPEGSAVLASNSLQTPVIGLIGQRGASGFERALVQTRLAHAASPERLASLGLEDEFAILGSFIAGPSGLRRFAANAPANTDDRPLVAYRAPRITYAPDSNPGDRLIALLRALSVDPQEIVRPATDSDWTLRLANYWAARDLFVESGKNVRPSANAKDMLAQVRDPLLSVLRLSPDFRPAYDPLLSMAVALGSSDATGARALLSELSHIQPARAEALQALTRLEP